MLLLAAGAIPAPGQGPAAVPAAYQDLYAVLQSRITAFDRTVSAQWKGSRSPVSFGAELLGANANRGRQLLEPKTRAGIRLELDRLRSLGVQSVTVPIGFPLLYRPFFEFNGNPADYQRFLDFYKELAAEIRSHGLKLVVESSQLFPGIYSRNSGFRLSDYYPTLNGRQLAAGRAQVAVTIARELRPDFLNLGSEPDTQAELNRKPMLRTPHYYSRLIGFLVQQLRQAGAAMPIGAGVGTWEKDGDALVKALCETGIDYIDLHVYPVNQHFFTNLITLTELAQARGKRVAISEAWLLKQRDSEFRQIQVASNPAIFARDAYSFWAPLDQAFLGALVKFANWKNLLYLSPFWTNYFWSYTDYGETGNTEPAQSMSRAYQLAGAALQQKHLTDTAVFYRDAIAGKLPAASGGSRP